MTKTQITPEQAVEELKKLGWREFALSRLHKCDRVFYRFFPSVFHCRWNEDKPGVQIELSLWDQRPFGDERVGFMMALRSGLSKQDRGLELKIQAGNHDEWQTFEASALQLVKVWEAANEIMI